MRTVARLLLAVVALSLAAAPAHAADYRYWSFWRSGPGAGWSFATEGPATARPVDGEVNGFRFAVSSDSATSATPRHAPDFAAVCGDTPREEGTKRVAVVVDFGTAADAPEGSRPPSPDQRAVCARVPEDATSAEALAAVAKPLRYSGDGLLCAISGYPRTGCGEQVAPDRTARGDVTASARPKPEAKQQDEAEDGGPSLGLVAGAAAVLALGAAAVVQARRRRR
ncbi:MULTISPECIES: SCO2322 family protein [unclassified Streptomyces]|uniref:SCO2322 family protein n=1 Tax=unclassified Streptomyces TaxID=2593676 RepID=UPI0033B893E9